MSPVVFIYIYGTNPRVQIHPADKIIGDQSRTTDYFIILFQ